MHAGRSIIFFLKKAYFFLTVSRLPDFPQIHFPQKSLSAIFAESTVLSANFCGKYFPQFCWKLITVSKQVYSVHGKYNSAAPASSEHVRPSDVATEWIRRCFIACSFEFLEMALVRLSEDEILLLGLESIGFDERRQRNTCHATNITRFYASFGAGPKSCIQILESFHGLDLQLKRFLSWTLTMASTKTWLHVCSKKRERCTKIFRSTFSAITFIKKCAVEQKASTGRPRKRNELLILCDDILK